MTEAGRYRQERYNHAIEVAAGLFLEKGIELVKMTDIAENCGIGVASLYRFFETKTEIVIRAGIIIWDEIRNDFMAYVSKDKGKTGMENLVYALAYYKKLYKDHKDFIKFLDDFDKLMLSEEIEKEKLIDYEKSIVNFSDPFKAAVEKGQKDGTVKKGIDVVSVYISVTHALLSLCQKFNRGEILPKDDFTHAEKEIEKLLEITAAYLAA